MFKKWLDNFVVAVWSTFATFLFCILMIIGMSINAYYTYKSYQDYKQAVIQLSKCNSLGDKEDDLLPRNNTKRTRGNFIREDR